MPSAPAERSSSPITSSTKSPYTPSRYGALLAGGCAAVARRSRAASKHRLQRVAAVACWFGPIAAAADLAQNISLALLLAGHIEQPWPRISAVADAVTLSFAAAALALIGFGLLATSARRVGSGRRS